jgi:hypothetical protein
MKTRAVSLFALALLCLGPLAGAADAPAGAGVAPAVPATLPALAAAAPSMSPAAPATCGGSFSLPTASAPSLPAAVFTCGTCSDSACVGAAPNASCGALRQCFVLQICTGFPKTWTCTCASAPP